MDISSAKSLESIPDADDLSHPPKKGRGVLFLIFDIDKRMMIFRVDNQREIHFLRIAERKPSISIGIPLHRSPDAVTIAKIIVVSHSNFVPVIDDRRTGKRKEEDVHQMDLRKSIVQQRRKSSSDAEIDTGPWIIGVRAVHIITLLFRHHFQGQFIVVSEKNRPLA